MSKILRPLVGWLSNQWIWQGSRFALDVAFGLYRKRFNLLNQWGVLEGTSSVLDIGCGSGDYAARCEGPYLGIDLSERDIARAGAASRTRTNRSAASM